jgi:Zn-finger nucleic acid-binding protein
MENSEEIPTSPDCCGVWPELREAFDWYKLDDSPRVLVMPHIDASTVWSKKVSWRVNFCPICGGNRRMVVWNTNKIQEDSTDD